VTLPDKNLVLKSMSELCGRTLYSFKTHAKQADIYRDRLDTLKVTEVILIALSACGILSSLTNLFAGAGYIAIVLNFFSLVISIHLSSNSYDDLIRQHRATAQELWLIKEKVINSINDFKQDLISVDDLRTNRDISIELLNKVYASEPQTSSKAYEAARKALRMSEEHTFSEAELDALLSQ